MSGEGTKPDAEESRPRVLDEAASANLRLAVDPSRCVLCGGPNECAMAGDSTERGEAASRPCWCVEATFPESLTRRATNRDGGASCVCRACLENPPD